MVFSGIVEEMGTVTALSNIDNADGGVQLTVSASLTSCEVAIGDSISVNGTCLTVTAVTPGSSFTFGLAPETLRRTNLGALASGDRVNLERSLRADGRFGGHVVQGHVDCVGAIASVRRERDSLWFDVAVPPALMPYVVEKGYVTVDGASLTVCDVDDAKCTFNFMMIAHTQTAVVTASKRVGDGVNVEVDITGKYIERILATRNLDSNRRVAAS